MTVRQALEHPWLRLEDPAYALPMGSGRSLGPQDSFNDFRSRASTAYDADLSTRSLSFNGLPIESGESMEDCSYPLTRLRLQTPMRQATVSPPSARTARHVDAHDVDSVDASPTRKPSGFVIEATSLTAQVPDSAPRSQGVEDSLASSNKRKLLEQSSSELSSVPDLEPASLNVAAAAAPKQTTTTPEQPPKKRQTRASIASRSTPTRTSTRLRSKKTGT